MLPVSVYMLYEESHTRLLIPQIPTTYGNLCVVDLKWDSDQINVERALGQYHITLMLL